MDDKVRKELTRAPGIGPSMADDLWRLGVRSLPELAAADPEELYARLQLLEGAHVDRCVLYAFRCAHYFAANERHDPELLQWWHWKDGAA